ncbi:DNA polymerase III subunit beta [Nitrospira defluvii]|uniref:Beta sliding clamp n=1 Tax=Nitrospira defluvii TaxID=330214 RepID=A0ABM8RYV4_9BACT|nr:DNA polymerase III subunit beta [Nitrospira defluvii]CAE6779423.1 Beta sliding clamp [Nitrospira defluvii]
MKLTIQARELTHALNSVIGGTDGRGPMASVLLMIDPLAPNTLTLTTTDNEIACRASAPVATATPGRSLLPIRKLYDIVRALPDIPLTITIIKHNATLLAGSSRYALAGLEPDQFPDVPSPLVENGVQLDAALWRGILRRTLYAIGQTGAKFTLHGLYVEIAGGVLTAVATDGHRLCLETLEIPGAGDLAWSGIIPRKAMIQLAKQLDGVETLTLGISYQRLVHIQAGSYAMTSRLIEGTYPNWRALVPQKAAPNALTVSREELIGAVKRASLVTTNGVIALDYTESGASITARSAEHGEAEEALAGSYMGTPFRAGFQDRYLTDTLGALDGEAVVCQQDGPAGALSIVDPAGPASRAYIMPIRLQ